MGETSYAIGLGSNRYRGRSPRATVEAAIEALTGTADVALVARSPIVDTAPLGPGSRRYANAAILIETALSPSELLQATQALERSFGRRRTRRWGDRILDLDILLWSGGCWGDAGLVIPHPEFRQRSFALGPLVAIAPAWIDPVTSLSIRQLETRQNRAIPVDRASPHP